MIQEVTTTSSNQLLTKTAIGNSALGKDEFLKLLTYQLKAQNPLKPYDNQEFAAQLAQFSQLEQLTDIRSLLEEQIASNSMFSQSLTNTAIPGLIGKTAKISSNEVVFDGSNNVKLGFSSPYDNVSGEIRIYNANGSLVKTMTLDHTNLDKGEHNVEWDGTDENGNSLDSGDYSFEVELRDSRGATTFAETYFVGKINSVKFKSDGTYLTVNEKEFAFDKITEIISEN